MKRRLSALLLLVFVSLATGVEPTDQEWVTYNNGSLGLFVYHGPQRAMLIVPADFGLSYPFQIESLLTRFYVGMGGFADSTFWYLIYGDDGQTPLYESESLLAVRPPAIFRYRLTTPVVITEGRFYIALRFRTYVSPFAYPFMTTDNNRGVNHCYYGTPGAWQKWDDGLGEFHVAAFVTSQVGVYEPSRVGWLEPVGMRVAPNPLVPGFATLRFSLAKRGPAMVTIYDIAGRPVLRQAYSVARSAYSTTLDCRKLSSGVYLVRFDADGVTQTEKLVVER